MADLYAKYNCTYCQEEIHGLRVRCAECADFDICLQCFSSGAEIGPHKNDHAYQIVDSGAVGIFQGRGGWSAKEEMQLLDAIEQFGFGNWEDIARDIETRTSEDAKDEYISRYLEGGVGRATWGAVAGTARPLLQCAEQDEGPLGPAAVARLAPLAVANDEAAQLGYMPNRDDFEREHDHEAEQIVSTLSLCPDDDDLDVALKLAQVDVYTRRLRERTRRKRIVRDYQLVSSFYTNARNKQKPLSKLARDKKELSDRLRVFAQFYSRASHAAVCEGVWRERELRLRLAELHRYRAAGVTCAEECIHYDQHALQRRNNSNSTHGSSGVAGGLDTPMQTQLLPKRRESENDSSSTNPRCTRDESTACGCSRRHSCSSNASLHLLTTNEMQLCNSLNLPPTQYITMKTVLLCAGGGGGGGGGAVVGGVAESAVQVYLRAAGWIS